MENWSGEQESARRPKTRIAVFYGNAFIVHLSVFQTCTYLSSIEAEHVALSEFAKNITWLRRVLEILGSHQDVTKIFEDSADALK